MNNDWLFGDIPIIRADRRPCPVCNHPTGDCADGAEPPRIVFGFGLWKSDESDPVKSGIVVEEDVYEMRRINPFFESRVLLVRKGQTISLQEARRLGLAD